MDNIVRWMVSTAYESHNVDYDRVFFGRGKKFLCKPHLVSLLAPELYTGHQESQPRLHFRSYSKRKVPFRSLSTINHRYIRKPIDSKGARVVQEVSPKNSTFGMPEALQWSASNLKNTYRAPKNGALAGEETEHLQTQPQIFLGEIPTVNPPQEGHQQAVEPHGRDAHHLVGRQDKLPPGWAHELVGEADEQAGEILVAIGDDAVQVLDVDFEEIGLG
ncbi:AP-2 complex subunit alpha [Striga asiatica]|uniref:AP-2 complex subunit alpha n=1 Tax=Striga asiatica TaxID=4170 RepID=A0A5A7QNM5_STRAF|nr:AP-2 complex subunit alpha [Striga asiatica]